MLDMHDEENPATPKKPTTSPRSLRLAAHGRNQASIVRPTSMLYYMSRQGGLVWQPESAEREFRLRLRSEARPHSQPAGSAVRTGTARGIYVVDDEPGVVELYRMLLEAEGYAVRGFGERTRALTALAAGPDKPVLLITDYLGHAMSVHRFLQQCLAVHPRLRVLMASGVHYPEARILSFGPHAFIRKPFTADAFVFAVASAFDLGPAAPGPGVR